MAVSSKQCCTEREKKVKVSSLHKRNYMAYANLTSSATFTHLRQHFSLIANAVFVYIELYFVLLRSLERQVDATIEVKVGG